jgi:hypothetical protein
MEQALWPSYSNFFVTYTYDDEHRPEDGSLDKGHGRAYRKALYAEHGNILRFFWVGEYGAELQRPHYHAVFFGLPFDQVAQRLKKPWSHGFISVSLLNPTRAAYVAQYTTKKITGDRSASHYGLRHPEFSQMSRRPALGDHFVARIATWLLKPHGQRYLEASGGDVPSEFSFNGQSWPIGQRHRRVLRRLVGLPELRAEVFAQRGELAPFIAPPTLEELSDAQNAFHSRRARAEIFQSSTSRVGDSRPTDGRVDRFRSRDSRF